MGRYGDLDYGWLATRGTLASLLLVVTGFAAGVAFPGAPGWERAVFLDAEVLGILGMVLCPFVFGVAMPLTE